MTRKKREAEAAALERAFGEESRRRMLEEYFAQAGEVTPANAWCHVYRLLLWTDGTTGLAHCYESDKAQPGRPWYARSLKFHDWVCSALGVAPAGLRSHIDWLFTHGTERLAAVVAKQQAEREPLAAEQRAPYEGRGFPLPGEDAGLEALVREELGEWLSAPPPAEAMRRLAQRVRRYLGQENKRKNLVGEGFEDVLAFLVRRLHGTSKLKVEARPALHTLPGFRPPRGTEKTRKVDIAIIGPKQKRVLVSAKWSIRADREEQFGTDFQAYSQLDGAGQDFDFVLVTNEFDAARLVKACEVRGQNTLLFRSVVHVNPAGPLHVYGPGAGRSAKRLFEHAESGRLMSLESWLASLVAPVRG